MDGGTWACVHSFVPCSYSCSAFWHIRVMRPAQAKFFSMGWAYFYSYEGSKSASGKKIEPGALTAAHRTLPFGTRVRVSDPNTGKSVVVTINDRGPFARGRVLDVSTSAAKILDMIDKGVIHVHAEVL